MDAFGCASSGALSERENLIAIDSGLDQIGWSSAGAERQCGLNFLVS